MRPGFICTRHYEAPERVGRKFGNWTEATLPFRLTDSEGMTCEGLVTDDDYADGQDWALAWGMNDCGFTGIEVWRGEWIAEIG